MKNMTEFELLVQEVADTIAHNECVTAGGPDALDWASLTPSRVCDYTDGMDQRDWPASVKGKNYAKFVAAVSARLIPSWCRKIT